MLTQKITYIVTAVSGILLLPVAYFIALSGFCMRDPNIIGTITFGLVSGYGLCTYLHLDVGPLLAVGIALIHIVASMEVLEAKLSLKGLSKILFFSFKILIWFLSIQIVMALFVFL